MRLPAVDTRTEGEREEKRRERERGAGSRRARRFPSYLCGPLVCRDRSNLLGLPVCLRTSLWTRVAQVSVQPRDSTEMKERKPYDKVVLIVHLRAVHGATSKLGPSSASFVRVASRGRVGGWRWLLRSLPARGSSRARVRSSASSRAGRPPPAPRARLPFVPSSFPLLPSASQPPGPGRRVSPERSVCWLWCVSVPPHTFCEVLNERARARRLRRLSQTLQLRKKRLEESHTPACVRWSLLPCLPSLRGETATL